MRKISILITILIVFYNICYSQKSISDNIILYGTVVRVTETDVIVNDLKVLTNNYNRNEISLYALMYNGPIWIRPDTSWIGKKVFASAQKDKNGNLAVNNYHPIMGKELSLTPNLSEFFVFDSTSNQDICITDKPDIVFEAIKNFYKIIQIGDCKKRADSLLSVVYDTTKYNFLREYAVYLLYNLYPKGECLYVNPFNIMKKIMDDKTLNILLRERSYYLLKSNSYPLNVINEYNYLLDLLNETDKKDYACYQLKELNSRAKVLLNTDKESLNEIEKLNIEKSNFIDTFKFQESGNILLYGNLSKVERGLIELRDVKVFDSINSTLNTISITCKNSDNTYFKKAFNLEGLNKPVLVQVFSESGKYFIDLKKYPEIGCYYFSLTPDGNAICFLTSEKLSELGINFSPSRIISDIKDFLVKRRTGHYDTYKIFDSNYCNFILYNTIWQFYKQPIQGIEYFPILQTRTNIISSLPPLQNVLLDRIIYPQIETPDIKNLIQLYTNFINSHQPIMVEYGKFRLLELKEILLKKVDENEIVIKCTKNYTCLSTSYL